jgi:hypothetical protein
MKTSSLVLTREQEEKLVDYAVHRMVSLEEDNRERMDADELSWDIYHNSRSDRRSPDTIFSKSNVPVPLTTLVVDHFVARAEDDLTGTTPYFRFDAQGPSDMEKAEAYDRYFNWKLEKRGHIRDALEEAYLQIFIQRAAVLKSTFNDDTTRYMDREARVLYHINGDTPVIIEGLGYIVEGQAVFLQMVDPMTGVPKMVLEDDPSFEFNPEQHEFREYTKGIEIEVVRYRGPRTVIVDSDRFFAPTSAESLNDADFIAEKYDKPLTWAEDLWLKRKYRSWTSYEANREKLDADSKTETFKNTESRENLSFDTDNKKLEIVECWIKRDVLGLGYPQEFVLFYDPNARVAIYYEYVAKITPDKRIPYTAISIGRDRNRWWGYSLPERIRVYQEYIDKQFNSQSFRNELSANPVVGANPQVLEEEPDDVEIHAGKVFTLKDGYTIKDFISAMELPKEPQKTQDLIDFVFGIVQLWLGVSNLAQGDYQALAPANTATGVEATLREAGKIGRRWARRVVRGFEEHITKQVKLAMATTNEKEVYEYLEGDVKHFQEMTPEKLQNLAVDVTVEMAQEQSQRALERADMALKTIERYFSYGPELRPFVKPMLENILKALSYENADNYLPEDAPDVPRDDTGKPVETPPQLSGAVQGQGNSNSGGANQHQKGINR